MEKRLSSNYTIHLLIFSGVFFVFHHLNQLGFFMDGLIYSAIAKNMALDNLFLHPHVSNTYYASFHDHIPFMPALMALLFKIFGIGFWQARLFISLFLFALFIFLLFLSFKNGKSKQAILLTLLFFLTLPMLKHARSPNFDNPLALTVFVSLYFYGLGVSQSKLHYWLISGLFFGLSMLLKGPMAVFIPMTMIIHLVVSKNLNVLSNIRPWLGFLFGFLVFSIWPFFLYHDGKIEIFYKWFQFTIIDTIFHSRGALEKDYFLYLRHLLLFTPIHLILFGMAIKMRKIINNIFFDVYSILFFVVLVITSFMTFKLSHYIMCLYPPLIFCASFFYLKIKSEKVFSMVTAFILISSLVVFFLPQNPKKIRDYEIFEIIKLIKEKNYQLEGFTVERGAYPYWSLASLMAFIDSIDVSEVTEFKTLPQFNSLYIVSEATLKQKGTFKNCEELYVLSRYQSRAYFCKN